MISGVEVVSEDLLRMRFNRKLTIRARGNIRFGMLPSEMQAAIEKDIEAIELPAGYEMQWGAEKEDSAMAQAGIKANMAAPTLAMILIIIMLFNNLKQPAIILLPYRVPLLVWLWGCWLEVYRLVLWHFLECSV